LSSERLVTFFLLAAELGRFSLERFGEPPFLVMWPTILLCVPV